MTVKVRFRQDPPLDTFRVRSQNAKGIWVDKYGKDTPIRKMDDNHLQNVERVLRKWARREYIIMLVDGLEPATSDLYAHGIEVVLNSYPFWPHLLREQKRRTLKKKISGFIRHMFHRRRR